MQDPGCSWTVPWTRTRMSSSHGSSISGITLSSPTSWEPSWLALRFALDSCHVYSYVLITAPLVLIVTPPSNCCPPPPQTYTADPLLEWIDVREFVIETYPWQPSFNVEKLRTLTPEDVGWNHGNDNYP